MDFVVTSLPCAWLRVPDDSMRQAGLLKGTLIHVTQESSYRNGQLVAVHLTTGRLLIRFIVSLSQHFIIVRTANPKYLTETIRRENVLRLARVDLASTVIV